MLAFRILSLFMLNCVRMHLKKGIVFPLFQNSQGSLVEKLGICGTVALYDPEINFKGF